MSIHKEGGLKMEIKVSSSIRNEAYNKASELSEEIFEIEIMPGFVITNIKDQENRIYIDSFDDPNAGKIYICQKK